MKLYEAKNIITEVFENPFDKDKFSYFIRNLLKNLHPAAFHRSGYNIPKAFENYIASYERIGKYEDEEGNLLDVLIVKLKRDHSIDYARSTQRNFIRWYLNDKGKDAALVAFHTHASPDWRFSFVKMQYSLEKQKDEFTPAKRASYMVGESGKSHTAQRQFIDLLKNDHAPSLSNIEDAFSIETVSDEFYEKYKTLLFNLVDEIETIIKKDNIVKQEFENKNISVINFSKKLLGQIVFLYFLQKKGWLGLKEGEKYGDGDRHFMRNLFVQAKREKKNFFNDFLEYLFYDALSKKRVTDYYEKFQTRIPFLNGGLFDPINFYDWEKTDIVIPNAIFSDKKGDEEGNGILDVFDLYNFTVKEDEPLETEVAIDPEMLGKVFERMLEVKERKSKGAFYTPREIVHYMAQQSLLYFLETELQSKNVSKQDLETFIHYGEHIIDKDIAIEEGKLKETANTRQIPQSIRDNAGAIDKALENIKICDPAVGSGAFPVGVMNEIVKLRKLLTPFIVSQASSLSASQSQTSHTKRTHDDSIIIYFDKNAETEIKRKDLPHWSHKGVAYFVTFRLADSIPDSAREEIRAERENWLKQHKIKDKSELQKLPVEARIEYYKLFSKRYDDLLDNGYGSCILARTEIKRIVEKALKYFDGERYFLDEFVVMPNHVHAIVIPKHGWTLEKITHSWKSFTANEINKLTGHTGQVWMHESFDHIIRSEKQLHRIRQYIRDNPKVSQTSSLKTSVPQASSLSTSQTGSLGHLGDRTAYAFKSNAIQNSIYGVDIDAGAVEIAKLRLWLSMVVDEERIDAIEPLPNLDYKIVQGNSLINIPDGTAINDALATEIEKLIKSYYYITDKQKKQEQKQVIDNKIQEQLSFVSGFAGYTIDFDFKLFFHEVFHEKNGFDVVIGNPPYIQLQKAFDEKRKYADLYKNMGFKTFERTGDIYALFYEKGMDVLNPNGNLIFISSNKWMRANYGKSLRRFLSTKDPLLLIDLGPGVFDTATVDTNILQVAKRPNRHALKALTLHSKEKIPRLTDKDFVTLKKLNEESWIILSPQEQKIKERIEQVGTPLKDWDISIYRGVLTGYNEAFIIDGKTKDELIRKDPKSAQIIKPILRGRDIKRYKAEFADLWLINSHNGYKDDKGNYIPPIDINNYPAIKEYLDQYWEKLKKRQDKGVTPYNLRNCAYLQEFEKEKIVWKRIGSVIRFCFSSIGEYTLDSTVIAVGKEVKYLTALLNSKLHIRELLMNSPKTGTGDVIISVQALTPLLVFRPREEKRQKPFETLVDYILFLKSQPNDNKSFYFEQIIDGMVYELYFEQEIKQAGCDILKYLNELPEINDAMPDEEKRGIITKVFNQLYDKESPVRKNLFFMDSVEEVAIIKKSLEK